jgi:hypothetical protein
MSYLNVQCSLQELGVHFNLVLAAVLRHFDSFVQKLNENFTRFFSATITLSINIIQQ